MTFDILAPDIDAPSFDIERGVTGDAFRYHVFDEVDPGSIPAGLWESCDGILVWHRMQITADVVARMRRCRHIVRVGVGFDNVDTAACRAAGIAVSNVPNYGTTEVADHGMALLLGLVRGIVPYQDRLRADLVGGFDATGMPMVRRLRGATFGAVGMGRIGTALARRARAFDMDIVYFDPLAPSGHELGLGFRRVADLETLLAQSDIVSLHAPLNAGTQGMMGAPEFARMKPGSLLINIARGRLVQLDALHDALRSGHLAGAGLDVLQQEPPATPHPLLAAWQAREAWLDGRLLVTPHAAYYSAASYFDMRSFSAETLRLSLVENHVRDRVN